MDVPSGFPYENMVILELHGKHFAVIIPLRSTLVTTSDASCYGYEAVTITGIIVQLQLVSQLSFLDPVTHQRCRVTGLHMSNSCRTASMDSMPSNMQPLGIGRWVQGIYLCELELFLSLL